MKHSARQQGKHLKMFSPLVSFSLEAPKFNFLHHSFLALDVFSWSDPTKVPVTAELHETKRHLRFESF